MKIDRDIMVYRFPLSGPKSSPMTGVIFVDYSYDSRRDPAIEILNLSDAALHIIGVVVNHEALVDLVRCYVRHCRMEDLLAKITERVEERDRRAENRDGQVEERDGRPD